TASARALASASTGGETSGGAGGGTGTRSAPTRPGALREGFDDRPDGSSGSSEPEGAEGEAADGAPTTGSLAPRYIARLLRYGERIGSDKIDVRMLPLQFHARSGALAVCDPDRPETWHVLERPIGTGSFRVMLSIARPDEDAGAGSTERLA